MDHRHWQEFEPDYASLTNFIDVFYGAVLSYGIYLIAQVFENHFEKGGFDWAPFLLLSFAVFYLIGDYVDARLYTAEFPYNRLRRFWLDLFVAITFFAAFVAGYQASESFVGIMAVAFFLGGWWCWALQHENRHDEKLDRKPLLVPEAPIAAHFISGVIFCALWYFHYGEQRVSVQVAGDLWLAYFGWGFLFFCIEVLFNIPCQEADLFPNFPLGRVLRDVRPFKKLIQKARKGIYSVLEIVIDFASNWKRHLRSEVTAAEENVNDELSE